MLSSAPVGGGDVRARRIVNLCVDGPDARAACDDPETTFAHLAAAESWSGPLVGLMTGVTADRLGIGDSDPGPVDPNHPMWIALATAGFGNAHRAGEPPPAGAGPPGTINIIASTHEALTPAARAEALALVAEAKAGLLADLGITVANTSHIATGTGTDAIAITCADGAAQPYTGYHTVSGQQLVIAVREAIRNSLRHGACVRDICERNPYR